MDSKLATRILQNAQIHLPGALDNAIKTEFYNVALEFLDGSDVWREDLKVHVRANKTAYELSPTAEVTRLIEFVDGNGIPVTATMAEPAVVILNNTPSVDDTFVATVAYKVNGVDSAGYPDMPDWITSKYLLDLIDGIVARMMAQPAKPYSNPTMAVYHMRKFRNGIATAKAQASGANLFGGQRWRFPGIAPARRQ
jgi:hypothetical protein